MICPCYKCNRRTVIPNCHSTCVEYQEWVKIRELAREARKKETLCDDARIRQFEIRKKHHFKQRRK